MTEGQPTDKQMSRRQFLKRTVALPPCSPPTFQVGTQMGQINRISSAFRRYGTRQYFYRQTQI
ncbi:MAG: hypothetical protein HW400_364 [Candidatus Levybacteria bacterium]|nr:hypothetical protein [Candidatus Levybacteria bacterium]